VSVNAVLTVFNCAELLVDSSVTVPTTKPALVIVVFAVLDAVPCGYSWFSFFSRTR
jgi:hypothetical protein